MKNNLFKTVIILIAVTFVTLQSCEKKELFDEKHIELTNELTYADMPELEVKEGMLYFENEEVFLKTINVIPNMTEIELNEWENKLGFISIRTKQNEFYNKLEGFNEETITDYDIRNLVEEYKKYFEIVEDENGEEEIKPLISDIVYSSITNDDLLYKTSIGINKVSSEKLFFSENLTKNEMLVINSENINSNIEILYYKNNNKNVSITATKEVNKSGCRNDRKVKITLETWFYIYSTYPQYKYAWAVEVTTRGYDKRVCIYYNYNTILDYKGVRGEIYVGYDTKLFSFPDYTSNRDVRSISDRNTYIKTSGQGYEGFIKSQAKGSSRGVGNLWAIIDNGY